jgi:uncharacterized membrane protein (DUF4010 family)
MGSAGGVVNVEDIAGLLCCLDGHTVHRNKQHTCKVTHAIALLANHVTGLLAVHEAGQLAAATALNFVLGPKTVKFSRLHAHRC